MVENNDLTAQQESIIAMLRQYNPTQADLYGHDILSERYRILVNQPLPKLNSDFATAYAVSDDLEPEALLYALVYKNDAPLRNKNIEVLKELRHPNMIALLDAGEVEVSILSEVRYVVILEKPLGQSLSAILSNGKNPASEDVMINYLLRPITEILASFSRSGISHNRINLDNVYINNNIITLGECVSEPSGFSQNFVFEPIERVITSPLAKSDNSITADCYALAVLTLHCLLGFKPFEGIDKDKFTESLLVKGAYHTLAIEWDFSEEMQDFFRALLNDGRRERWNPESIESWISGRHFNLILPSLPHESSRSFEFMGKAYYNRKGIAYALFRNWYDARLVLFDNKLSRWIDSAAHKPELADAVLRFVTSSSNDNVRSERYNSELLARTIILLDPVGPIRLNYLSVMLDGIGCFLTSAFLAGNHDDVHMVVHMLESDLPWFWLEQQNGSLEYNNVILKLQRTRHHIRMNSPGFGIERCIYEFYPNLPCQSKLVKKYHVTTLAQLMSALNIVAQQKAIQEDFMDKHIAGFIGSRLDISRGMRVTELDVFPKLAYHPGLIGLKLLLSAQNKLEDKVFHGLSLWVALKLLPILDNIHKNVLRQNLQKDIITAASYGSLKKIEKILLNTDTFVSDYSSFQNASATYQLRRSQIEMLMDNKVLTRHSRIVGRGISQIISYGVCLITIYYTLKTYFHF